MIRGFLNLFYDFNKWGLMFYWVFYIKALFRGTVEWYAFMMSLMSFLYLASSVAWFWRKKTFPKVGNKPEYKWGKG